MHIWNCCRNCAFSSWFVVASAAVVVVVWGFNFALDFVFEGKLRASDLPGRDDGAFECQFNILSLKKKALTVNPACGHFHMDNPWP